MYKVKFYFDKDAETKWLNEMSAQGYSFSKFFAGVYKFEECTPGEYLYQIDILDSLSPSEEYKAIMNEAGIEIVQQWGFWVILRKRAAEGDFELYTDVDSKIEHYKKIRMLFKVVTIIELLIMFYYIFMYCDSRNGIVLGGACFFFAIVVVLAKALFRTNNIIADLEVQKTGIEPENKRNISAILPAGLLLNSCALLIGDSISYPIKLTLQILAIAFMAAGIVFTCSKKK